MLDVDRFEAGRLLEFESTYPPMVRLRSRAKVAHLWYRDTASTRPNGAKEWSRGGLSGDVRADRGYVRGWPPEGWQRIRAGCLREQGTLFSELDLRPWVRPSEQRSDGVGALWALQAQRGVLSGIARR